jgi:uncharacterized protein (DUF1015 family)
MATIKPFKAIRPLESMAERIAALPYDVVSREEAKQMACGNEYSFLRVDRAEIDLSDDTPFNHPEVYRRASENLKGLVNSRAMLIEDRERLYIYQLQAGGVCQTGLVCCISVDDYTAGIVKKHEHTREDKERDRMEHILHCNAHTGPILLFYRERNRLQSEIEGWTLSNAPVYDFTSEDHVSHRVWVIDDDKLTRRLIEAFAGIDSLYIADGHHRCAAAVKAGLLKRRQRSGQRDEYDYFLGVIFPHTQLKIMDYNRAVADLNGLGHKQFIERLRDRFSIDRMPRGVRYRPDKPHRFGMFIKDRWYRLEALPGSWDQYEPVSRLDVSILQNNILSPVLGIENPRVDRRIDFVGGIRGIEELERMVLDDGYSVAFCLYPTSIDDLMSVSDAGLVMPPKSTWFEPKLRSGLFIHSCQGDGSCGNF